MTGASLVMGASRRSQLELKLDTVAGICLWQMHIDKTIRKIGGAHTPDNGRSENMQCRTIPPTRPHAPTTADRPARPKLFTKEDTEWGSQGIPGGHGGVLKRNGGMGGVLRRNVFHMFGHVFRRMCLIHSIAT